MTSASLEEVFLTPEKKTSRLIETEGMVFKRKMNSKFLLKVQYATFHGPVNKETELLIHEIVVCRS